MVIAVTAGVAAGAAAGAPPRWLLAAILAVTVLLAASLVHRSRPAPARWGPFPRLRRSGSPAAGGAPSAL
ncbi:MAG TPA: hypothetical protein VE664_00680, partial [Actinomycetes bacterium]|nr:hypothetical protein [Actinomycetes bacterium]